MWRCPKCGSDALSVTITTQADLYQTDDGEIEGTEVDGDHEWDERSTMRCKECFHDGESRTFDGQRRRRRRALPHTGAPMTPATRVRVTEIKGGFYIERPGSSANVLSNFASHTPRDWHLLWEDAARFASRACAEKAARFDGYEVVE